MVKHSGGALVTEHSGNGRTLKTEYVLPSNVFVTGGTGTLGLALAKRLAADYPHVTLTVYSRDALRQQAMRRLYPQYRYIVGDVCDYETLAAAITGHDLVIHAAALKHIPECELNPSYTHTINVQGSFNVLYASLNSGVKQLLTIGTDKECHPVNFYGMTKGIVSRFYQHMAQVLAGTMRINLVRYGNVLDSNGSVLKAWSDAVAQGVKPRITDPTMTRFWLSDSQAIDAILYALTEPSSTITIPRLPGLSMGRMFDYLYPNDEYEVIGLRPGEKMHEELLTLEEARFTEKSSGRYLRLYPVTGQPLNSESYPGGYTSDIAPELTKEKLVGMVGVIA